MFMESAVDSTSAEHAGRASYGSISQFVELGRRILDVEEKAELSALSSSSSSSSLSVSPQLSRMRVIDTTSGVGGKALLAVAPIDGLQLALGHRELSPGDYVELSSNQAGSSKARGIVWRITREAIVVSVGADDIDATILDAKSINVKKRGNDVTYKRQRSALRALAEARPHPVIDVMFGNISPSIDQSIYEKASSYFEEQFDSNLSSSAKKFRLNAEQREAVCTATAANHLALIHGPPGTGKTATLSLAIIISVRVRGDRILACAPSNIAADTLLERLVHDDPQLRCVRVGNPARLLDSVLECSLDSLLEDHFSGVSRQIQRDISIAQKTLWRSGASRDARSEARAKLRELRKELRQREKDALSFVLDEADVIVTTCAGAFDPKLKDFRTASTDELNIHPQIRFDACFLDEAATALEPLAWCALIGARRCVLAGDDRQLPPTILANDENIARDGLNLTAFARARQVLGSSRIQVLRRQYRMHAVIAQFSSEMFYESKLIHDEIVKDHTIADLLTVRARSHESHRSSSDTSSDAFPSDQTAAIVFIDTCGCDLFEATEAGIVDTQELRRDRSREARKAKASKGNLNSDRHQEDSSSRMNEGEAAIVLMHVRNLVECGVSANDIAVITPYAAQCRRLRRLLSADQSLLSVEVGTVDSYQGRESEAVVFSATRSSENGGENGIGFLGDIRRFNVALTRARRSFTLIGDSATLSQHPVLSKFIQYVERRTLADYRSGFSYISY